MRETKRSQGDSRNECQMEEEITILLSNESSAELHSKQSINNFDDEY